MGLCRKRLLASYDAFGFKSENKLNFLMYFAKKVNYIGKTRIFNQLRRDAAFVLNLHNCT